MKGESKCARGQKKPGKTRLIILKNGGVAEVSESTRHLWRLGGEQTRCSANKTKVVGDNSKYK